ncbi:MAG: DUF4160 domain-containing protein [Clostridia bacterium]|nr:DUF4160 domain-containing protein [Clostridia bacterium]
MPTISMFYGIIIRMYYTDHNPPHIHAYYNEYIASFNFDGNIMDGFIPEKQTKLIKAWIELHKEELLANWSLSRNSEKPFKIKPLN